MNTYPSLAERVLGISPPFDNPEAMLQQAYATLTGEQGNMDQLLAENAAVFQTVTARIAAVGLARALHEVEPAVLERSVTLNMLVGLLKDGESAYGSLLGTLPLYQALYNEHVAPPRQEQLANQASGQLGQQPSRKALLVGSISPLSSAAFVTLSECVMEAQPWIVDPKNDHYGQRHGNFVKANGLALPGSWAGSMYAVVTNRLLHMLVDTEGQLTSTTEQQTSQQFATAMFRLLESGGHLLLCEQPRQADPEDDKCEGGHNREVVATFDDMLHTTLGEAGFSNISITAGWETGNSDYLFQPFNPSQPIAPRIERPYIRAVYAQKEGA